MGIENMRRWPLYIALSVCVLLMLSLFNSWSKEPELRNRVNEVFTQLQECSKELTGCMSKSVTLLEVQERYVVKVNDLEKQKLDLESDVFIFKHKLTKTEIQVNQMGIDVEVCKTELQSLKNVQVSNKAVLETLKIEEDRLTTQLNERKQKVEELEKEVERLKLALTTKSTQNHLISSKVTPAAQPTKVSPALNVHNPINEPVLENNAREEMEDAALNDGNDFDPQLK